MLPVPVTHESPHPRVNAAPTTDAPFVPVRDSAIHFATASDHTHDAEPLPPSGLWIPGNNLPIATDASGPRVTLETTKKPIALSHMDAGSLIHDVKPIYPHIAVETHTEGTVVLHAFISREGMIESLQVVSGHPLLAHAAVEAVRQWRYRPYVLNGEPLEVETQITVKFTLGKN